MALRAALLAACSLAVALSQPTRPNRGTSVSEQIQIPAGKESLPAEEVFKNIEILRGKPASRLPAMMKALNRLLGVECTHCHVAGAWEKEEPEAKRTTRRMFKMVATVSRKYFDDKPAVTCWTCHRGTPKPSNAEIETDRTMTKLTPEEKRLIAERMPAEKNSPAQQVFQNVQVFDGKLAEDLLKAMAVFTISLGTDCAHCHLADQYDDDDKPAKQTTREMVSMVNSINQQLFDGQAKVECWTCHRGAVKPETVPTSTN